MGVMFVNSYKLFFIIIFLSILSIIASCNSKYVSSSLSDLGGVYSSSFSDIDFSEEISRDLNSTESEYCIAYDESESSIDATTENQYSNKLLRWGIARKKDNQIPDADPGAPELLKKYGGLYLGDKNKKEIYLTFDEGYENGYTGKILDVLRENNVKAVFFITGPYLKEHQDLVRRMIDEDHIVGNHTIHHPSLPSLDDNKLEEEVLGLDRAFYEKFGSNMKFLRPPKGEYSEKTLAVTKKLGYTNLFWSFAYDDWHRDKIRGVEFTYNKVIENLHNGAILLLHAVSKDNADALDSIIKGARKKGYEFGDIESLIADN